VESSKPVTLLNLAHALDMFDLQEGNSLVTYDCPSGFSLWHTLWTEIELLLLLLPKSNSSHKRPAARPPAHRN
jgi:hypothetical protein